MSRPLVFASVVVALTSACSFYAFDDYTDSSNPDAASDASADVDASAASDGGVDPSSEAGATDPYGDAVRADKPVAWYRFEEDPIANAAKDSAGNRTANLITGGMGFGAKGISGRGIATDGGGGSGFTLGNDLGFAGATPFSLEVWIKPVLRNMEHYLFDKRESVDGSLQGWIFYLTEDLTPRFEDWGTTISARGDGPLPAGYVHVVITVAFDGSSGNSKLWLNGQPQPKTFSDPATPTPATTVALQLLSNFEGEADELAIYDKALAPDRILVHYVAGKP